jgi:hypothetical protein
MLIAILLTLILFAILWPQMTRKVIGFAIGAVVVLIVIGSIFAPKEPTATVAANTPATTKPAWNPPPDPGADQYISKVDFTTKWAIGLRGFKTLQELQTATDAKGVITGRELDGPRPSATFMWSSQPPSKKIDDDKIPASMIANVLPNGVFAYINTSEGRYITVDSTGVVRCDECVPPINIAGSR